MAPETLVDPETDPTATYAIDPALVRRLTDRVVCAARPPRMQTRTPMTGAPLADLPMSTPDDVEVAYQGARSAARAWSRTPLERRAQVFLRFHDLVLERQTELLDLIQLESGKARRHAFEEIADVAMVCRHYARRAAGYLRPRRRAGALPVLSQAVELHQPRGVVGFVSPWNYPLSMSITDLIPALIAGNTAVLRPDTQAALTALQAVALLDAVGLPEGVLKVVLGDGPTVGKAVLDRADYVCFTGSTQTGRGVARDAGERLVGASLELGGKNPMYVAADADLDRAVACAVRACFSSAGQLCVSVERLILHESIADEFLAAFVPATRALRMSADLAYGPELGSLVGADQLRRVTAHVEDARRQGARVLTGGRSRPDLGPYFYEPTVLDDVTPEMACAREETFGPVVAVYRAGSDEAAIRLANDSEFGLNAVVCTKDTRRGRAIAASIQAGTVSVNDSYAAAWGSLGAPMGGLKSSGLGRRHGAEGILKYTESQNVTVQRLLPVAPVLGMSDARFADVLTAALRAMKRFGLR
ncbi:succinic semialdehyde dehydrogenase [Segeticoccus rhizosphaerae]|jgi:succinate-semialdehyde dehydrogenase/glutarate-semialdehyde dehydrogenase|uniref:succinic semialdehyde dehydrogenase n=1 Tax=Segeticoccus rhizosphaerae TaxID=1104777 RepID=UPI0010BF703B|nr:MULTISPECIES: succinic semialdehyde dehydrogenase [Intrasporangiaceae]